MLLKLKFDENTTIVTKLNSVVDFTDPLYSVGEDSFKYIEYCQLLNIKPGDIFQYADKLVGDIVVKGDQIAHKKSVFQTKKIVSDYQGTIDKIDHQQGLIAIRIDESIKTITNSFFKGKVIEVDHKNHTLTVEINSETFFEVTLGAGSDGGEYSLIIDDNTFFTVNEAVINDKIIITDNININLATKLSALGARGIIYTEGTPPDNILTWKLNHKQDLIKIGKTKTKYVIISGSEKKIIVYN